MFWDAPLDSRHLPYAGGLAATAVLVGLVGALFAWEAASRRLPMRQSHAWGTLAAWASSWVGLIWVVGSAGRHASWDLAGPLWMRQAGTPLHLPLQFVAAAIAFPVLVAVLFGLFAWMLHAKRWVEAYTILLGGGGLVGSCVAMKLVFPRAAPSAQAFFAGATAFPNDAAALVPAGLAAWLWLRHRLGIASGKAMVWGVGALGVLGAVAPWLLGQARTTDLLAGLLLCATWLTTAWMGLHLVEQARTHGPPVPTPAHGGPPRRPILARLMEALENVAGRAFANPAPWLWGAVALGVLLRFASAWRPLGVDAFVYAAMGNQVLHTGGFLMPWGDAHTYATTPVPSHHYPPLYPLYLAGFYWTLGFSAATTHAASITASLAALAATWFCTRDLYGPRKALLATAVVALNPLFIQGAGQGYSETLVLLLFVATLWAILKSLERPWFILPAGLLAGLGYLTKSSMGAFFLIAGLGGLAWRLHWKGWRVLRDPPYLAAIAAFGLLVGGWALRNWRLFGTWETSHHIAAAYRHALAHPLQWGWLTLVTLVFYATVGYLACTALLAWIPRLRTAPKLGTEHDSGLWLALGLPLLLTALIDAALWMTEREFYVANVRYIGFVAVPAVWLLVRHLDPARRAVRVGAVATFLLLAVAALAAGTPGTSRMQGFADDLGARLQPGDSVGFIDANAHGAYRFYFQLTRDGAQEVPVRIACAMDPLCPPETPGPGSLNTTWVVVFGEFNASSALSPRYTLTSLATPSDLRGPNALHLWHRG